MKYKYVEIIGPSLYGFGIGNRYVIVLRPENENKVGYYLLNNGEETSNGGPQVCEKFPKSYREAVSLLKNSYILKKNKNVSRLHFPAFDIISKKVHVG